MGLRVLNQQGLCCKASAGAPRQGSSAGGMQQVLRTKLEQIVAANQLQQFYPPQALQAVLMRLNNVDFRRADARHPASAAM